MQRTSWATVARVSGWALLGLTVTLVVPSILLATSNEPALIPVSSDLEVATSTQTVIMGSILFVAYALVGAVILSQRPDNRLGWLFAASGSVAALELFSQNYGYRALAVQPGAWSWGPAVAWVEDLLVLPVLGLLTVFLFLLFPDGQLRSSADRRTAFVAVVGIGFGTFASALEPSVQGYVGVATPIGLDLSAAWSEALLILAWVALLGTLVASLVLLVGRLRRAVGEERDQLRILAWAAVVGTLLFAPALILPSDVGRRYGLFVPGVVGLLMIPASVGVAILRHRLLDIDLVIRRTVVFAVLVVVITAIYVGVVVGIGALVGSTGNAVLSAVAAALVAVAFQPLRRWAQRLANRLVYGNRASPYEVLHEFSERVAGAYRTEDVLPRMASILGEGTGAARAQIWLRVGAQLRPEAVWPPSDVRSPAVPVDGGDLPVLNDVSYAVAVRDRGELLGALSVTTPGLETPSPTESKLVGDLALQAGLILRNVQLIEDLRASRQRLVSAQDDQRRKLERDIHDGAQQQLVALAIKSRLVDVMIDKDADAAHRLATEIGAETQEALEALRDLARGIYPPLLADKGLCAALESQARKSPVDVNIHADEIGRFPQDVEAAAYFCCLEAMQNIAKYAQATRVDLAVTMGVGTLEFEVRDDGVGFDPDSVSRGAGLQNMVDRLDALGGRVEIDSRPGAGTSIRGRIPLGVGSPASRSVSGEVSA